jgi:hypothetical protein
MMFSGRDRRTSRGVCTSSGFPIPIRRLSGLAVANVLQDQLKVACVFCAALCAASTSLKTIASAVRFDRQPAERIVRCQKLVPSAKRHALTRILGDQNDLLLGDQNDLSV